MDDYLKEYVRLMTNISIDDNYTKKILSKINEREISKRKEIKKQIAVASFVVVTVASGISFCFRSGNKIR